MMKLAQNMLTLLRYDVLYLCLVRFKSEQSQRENPHFDLDGDFLGDPDRDRYPFVRQLLFCDRDPPIAEPYDPSGAR